MRNAGFIDKAAPTIEALKIGILNTPEARENFDLDPFSIYDKEEPFAITLEKEKGKIAAKNRPTGGFGFGAQSGTGGNTPSTGGTSGSGTTTPKKTTKTSQSTSRSRGGTS
jgi:hypothetical protein